MFNLQVIELDRKESATIRYMRDVMQNQNNPEMKQEKKNSTVYANKPPIKPTAKSTPTKTRVGSYMDNTKSSAMKAKHRDSLTSLRRNRSNSLDAPSNAASMQTAVATSSRKHKPLSHSLKSHPNASNPADDTVVFNRVRSHSYTGDGVSSADLATNIISIRAGVITGQHKDADRVESKDAWT